MKRSKPQPAGRSQGGSGAPASLREAAFTRIESAAVLGVLGVLMVLALPSLGGRERKSQTLTCMDNQRRLSLGWVLFAHDHDERVVVNKHGGDLLYPGSTDPFKQNWALGWLDWSTSPHNTNLANLTADTHAALARYVDHEARIFHCPADTYLSRVQVARQWTHRVRSYCANVAVGGANATSGPWDPTFALVTRLGDLQIPGPAESYVFLEEHPDSINDPAFFSPYRTQWIDLPAGHHGGGMVASFADGHVGLHRWENARTIQPVRFSFFAPAVARTDPDVGWLRFHTPRLTESY